MDRSGLLLATLAVFILVLMSLVYLVVSDEAEPKVVVDSGLSGPAAFVDQVPSAEVVESRPRVPASLPDESRPAAAVPEPEKVVLPPVRTIEIRDVAGQEPESLPVIDPELPDYLPVEGLSGVIKSVGSDTMHNLMTLWVEGFQNHYPNVAVEIEGRGSSTAPPALIEGISNFGPMSRKMKDKEIEAFELKFGYKPTALVTSIDMLAVYVNASNPLPSLNLAQVDAIFTRTRKLNAPADIATWDQLGLDGAWLTQSLSLCGRQANSGTRDYFKQVALGRGDFKEEVQELASGAAVVQRIASDPFAIGYGPIGHKTPGVRALPLARKAGDEAIDPVGARASYISYPLARRLLLYLNKAPNEPLDPLRLEFIKFIFSRQGQAEVVKDGYLPVSATIAKKMLAKCGIGLAD